MPFWLWPWPSGKLSTTRQSGLGPHNWLVPVIQTIESSTDSYSSKAAGRGVVPIDRKDGMGGANANQILGEACDHCLAVVHAA